MTTRSPSPAISPNAAAPARTALNLNKRRTRKCLTAHVCFVEQQIIRQAWAALRSALAAIVGTRPMLATPVCAV